MTDAPKTIWTTGNAKTGSWNDEEVNPRIAPTQHEYTLTSTVAAQLKAADAVAVMQASCGISTLGLTQAITAYRKAKDEAQ